MTLGDLFDLRMRCHMKRLDSFAKALAETERELFGTVSYEPPAIPLWKRVLDSSHTQTVADEKEVVDQSEEKL